MLDSIDSWECIIHTPLQRGGWRKVRVENRFSGFRRRGQTVETVSLLPGRPVTPLKRGVNEKADKHWRFNRI
jgi:hypothetical protein